MPTPPGFKMEKSQKKYNAASMFKLFVAESEHVYPHDASLLLILLKTISKNIASAMIGSLLERLDVNEQSLPDFADGFLGSTIVNDAAAHYISIIFPHPK